MIHFIVLVASMLLTVEATKTVVTVFTEKPEDEEDGETNHKALALLDDGLPNYWKTLLASADQGYQTFVRTHIDPLLAGQSRDRHLQELLSGGERELSPHEMSTNRSMGLGFLGLGLLGVVYATGLPLIHLVILIGFYNLWPWYKQGYRMAVDEKKLSIIHLIGVYFSLMWLGGFFFVGTLGSIFSGLCQKIHVITQIGARNALVDVLGQKPRFVWVDINGAELEIPFEQLTIGHILVLDAGQMIPVDGVIVDGWALVDQHRLTGESQPIEKSVGDAALAATVVLGGKLRVRVERTGADTAAAQISSILSNTVAYETDKVAGLAAQFRSVENTLWPMLMGGALGWLLAGPVAGAAALGCNYVVGIVPLRMITLLNALSTGSNHGILIKDGRALESLKTIDTLVFDKTGTLTLEQPQLIAIHPCGTRCENDVLTLAATAEHRQSHPIAQAIVAEAKTRGLRLPDIDAAHYEVGYGLKVRIEGVDVRVGSQRFMTMENIPTPASMRATMERCSQEGGSLVYIAADGELAGAIELDATLRPEAKTMVQWLKQQGFVLNIISGDQEAPTRRLAEELGMDGYFANTLPDQKANLIELLQSQGHKVCFIGDGINDAIALHQADVSISFRGATSVASDSAQIVLMEDNLEQLLALFELARAYEQNLATNYRGAVLRSLIAAAAVLLLPFKFLIVEGLWVVTFAHGITTATQPLLITKGESGEMSTQNTG
ncbi:MAG: heavy metal translocating P-type ATPase [Methylococcaceae bacterium]|nr:MAG: heavy metal translocating P-type ATPase [Methylococcaceae bacterium]